MRSIILSLLILITQTDLFSQIKVERSKVLSGNSISFDPDLDWSYHLQNYSDSIGKSVSRSSILNEHANNRAVYFSGLLDFNSMDKKLKDSMHQIPDDSKSHTRRYGNPDYFKEPEGSNYVSLYTDLSKGGIKREVQKEIMQECYYAIKTESPVDYQELIVKSIKAQKKKKGNAYILNNYLKSPSHKSAIEDPKSSKYGTSSCFIIHQWYDQEGKIWVNEVLIVNVTIFS